jgi:hypothetical protein
MDALFDDRLLEFAQEQQTENPRQQNSPPVKELSKEREQEIRNKKVLNYLYKD